MPLYLVIAGGRRSRPRLRVRACRAASGGAGAADPCRDPRWPPTGCRDPRRVVVLYALQTLYSEDFSKGLQNVCFFLVPFTVAYALLRESSGTAGC